MSGRAIHALSKLEYLKGVLGNHWPMGLGDLFILWLDEKTPGLITMGKYQVGSYLTSKKVGVLAFVHYPGSRLG